MSSRVRRIRARFFFGEDRHDGPEVDCITDARHDRFVLYEPDVDTDGCIEADLEVLVDLEDCR